MKPIVFTNIINVILLMPIVIIYFLVGCPLGYIGIFVAYFVYVIIINIHVIKSDDVIVQLKRADKTNSFRKEINAMIKCKETVDFYHDIFSKYDNNIKETYDTLSKRSEHNIEKAIRWLKSYNHISGESREYIYRRAEESALIIVKLNELNQLVIDIEDSATDIDMSKVDDMLAALKDVLSND